jgi:hypothetical protein
VTALESTSKAAAAISVALILALQLAIHPDMTWTLRAVSGAAFAIGWALSAKSAERATALWVLLAPLAPALVFTFASREGPVVAVTWMAGLAGALLRATPWSRWTIAPGWQPLVGGAALVLSLAWPVIVGREVAFDPRLFADAGAINSWAVPQLSASHAAGWTLHVVLLQLIGLLWLDWTASRMAARTDSWPLAAHGLWIGATVASLVAIYQGTIDIEFLNRPHWINERRATGTMMDGNALGFCAAIAGPMAFVLLWFPPGPRAQGLHRRGLHAIAVLALIVNLLGTWMAGSRTAFLCGVLAMMGLAVAAWTTAPAGRTKRMLPVLAGAVLIAGGIAAFSASAVGPVRRLLAVPPTAESVVKLVVERDGYGTVANQITREYPITGVGVGGYPVIAPDYWHVYDVGSLPFDNAQNWWRHQVAELGLLGAFPILALSGAVLWLVLAGRTRGQPDAPSIVGRMLLAALGLCSIAGVPTADPVVLLWFFLLTGCVLGRHPEAGLAPVARHTRAAWVLVTAVALAHASLSLALATGSLSVRARAIRWQREYVVGAYPAEPYTSGGFHWTRREARFVWPETSRWLMIQLWAHHPDIARRPVQVRLATPCAPLFEEPLRTADPVTIAVEMPAGQPAVSASLSVDRTWRPSANGGEDTRDLGAGIAVRYENAPEMEPGTRTVRLEACTL